MKNFDYKKYLAEGKLLKEHTVTFSKEEMATLHNDGKLIKKDEEGKDHTYVYSEGEVKLEEFEDMRPKDIEFEKAKEEERLANHPEEETIRKIQAMFADEKSLEESKEYLEPNELKELGYSHGGKYLNDIEDSLFNQPYFDYYLSGFIKGLQDNAEASQDYADSIKINDEDPYLEEGDSKMKDLESQLDFHTQMDNMGRASIIKDKIEKLRKLSNSGEIDGDEFLDKFNPLSKELKSLDEGNVVDSAKSALKAMPMLDVYIQSLESDIEKNGEDGYVDFGVEDFIEDYSEFIVDKLDS